MFAVMDLDTRKATMRRLVLARRMRIEPAARAAASAAVAERLASVPEASAARAVLGFASFGTELPTDPSMAWLLRSGRRLLMPYVDGEDLRAAEIHAVEDLAPGYRGIREPAERIAVDPAEADLILVPGVAFDGAGRRLGYGGGFYDAFLAGIERGIPRIGLCFEIQIVGEVPAGDRDEKVTAVVTEQRVVRAEKG